VITGRLSGIKEEVDHVGIITGFFGRSERRGGMSALDGR
jgi:hypothetical protein